MPESPPNADAHDGADDESLEIEDAAPPRIAILGAGPIGLEAAMYARFLGFSVTVFERGRIAEHVLRWGHVQMFSPFSLNHSPLGLAAIQAQDADYRPPAPDAYLTGCEWANQYLLPLARTDLLEGSVREECEVLGVGRAAQLKGENIGATERSQAPLRVLFRERENGDAVEEFDFVLDCTGVYATPNFCGEGGLPARGELQARPHMIVHLPNPLGIDRKQFEGKNTLVVGNGYSAATTIVGLARLAQEAAGSTFTWITRRPLSSGEGPISRIANDRLPERDRLAKMANTIATQGAAGATHWANTSVASIAYRQDTNDFSVTLVGEHSGTGIFHQIVALVGYRGESRIYQELHVHECYASGGPMSLAAALLAQRRSGAPEGGNDCLAQHACGAASLLSPEPNFFVLGAKSYGRNSSFLVRLGIDQVRDVFTLIQGRENLDLHAQFDKSNL